jgi:hypothetical protein
MGESTCRLRLGHGSAFAQHSKKVRGKSKERLLMYHELVDPDWCAVDPSYSASSAAVSPTTSGGSGGIRRFVPVEVCQSSNMYLLPPKAVTTTDAPLARFINHGVPVVLATDNDGVMRMVGGGDFTGQSVLSEMWRAVLHGHFAPHVPNPFPTGTRLSAMTSGNTIVCEGEDASGNKVICEGVHHGYDFWAATEASIRKVLMHMQQSRFGRPIRMPASIMPQASMEIVALASDDAGTTHTVGSHGASPPAATAAVVTGSEALP